MLNAAMVSIAEIEAIVEKGRELQALLKESPNIVQFLRLVKETGKSMAALPALSDVLICAGEAANVLKVDRGSVYRYEKAGLLKAYYTPGSPRKKFWLSDVKELARPMPSEMEALEELKEEAT